MPLAAQGKPHARSPVKNSAFSDGESGARYDVPTVLERVVFFLLDCTHRDGRSRRVFDLESKEMFRNVCHWGALSTEKP